MDLVLSTFLLFVLIGFIAQMIDGALGMAYGVASTSMLMALGMPPALASANVHAAEVFTSGASGLSHGLLKNVDWRLMAKLALAGMGGAALGALLISHVDLKAAQPFIAAYLFAMGLLVIHKAVAPQKPIVRIGKVRVLGFVGGFVDTAGGGGWGPVVASNMIARGGDPVRTIGTVNCAEFFMTLMATVVFIAALGPVFGQAAFGMVIGGVAAAPIAALVAKRLPRRALLVLVGAAICALSVYNFASYFVAH